MAVFSVLPLAFSAPNWCEGGTVQNDARIPTKYLTKSNSMSFKLCGAIFAFVMFGAVNAEMIDKDAPRNQAVPVQEFSPVLVQGLGNPAVTSYAKLLEGSAAFNANQQLAPNAALRFRIIDRAMSGPPLSLRLETRDKVAHIDVAVDGQFILPSAEEVGADEGEVVANRRAGDLVIYPFVRSPGLGPEIRRLGDIRLWCEVFTVISRDQLPLKMRLMMALGGNVCKSSRNKIFQRYAGPALTHVELIQGDRKIAATIDAEANAFSVPLDDVTWSNDATIQLVFGDK